MFRYAFLIVVLFSFFPVYTQTELKSIEKCDFQLEEKNKIQLSTEAIDCSSPPEGYFLLSSNEEVSKFYSSYPSSQSSCNTYQLPRFNFDTCKVLFYRISYWTGAQVQKSLYYLQGATTFVLELQFKSKEINTSVSFDSGYLVISKRYLSKEPVVFTCHKEIN